SPQASPVPTCAWSGARTAAPAALREDRLVAHDLALGPEGHEEQIERAELCVLDLPRPLRRVRTAGAVEDQRERLPAAGTAVVVRGPVGAGKRDLERVSIGSRDGERLPDPRLEVLDGELV